ncbi:MAG: hypothetical protein H6622_10655 [Halobacteriovoraceae bacterium]|nr:hypothetical protein [Halobacteriovoraceae bacterium]
MKILIRVIIGIAILVFIFFDVDNGKKDNETVKTTKEVSKDSKKIKENKVENKENVVKDLKKKPDNEAKVKQNTQETKKNDKEVSPPNVKNENKLPLNKEGYTEKINEGEKILVPINTPSQETILKNEELAKKVKELELRTKKKISEKEMEKINTTPDYLAQGRGLVYNCKEKFWACLNRSSYRRCQKNYNLKTKKNQKKECVPVEVYNTTDECEVMQTEKVSYANIPASCK